MNETYKEGFRDLYRVILKNVSTIEDLIKQLEELENIISSIAVEQSSTKNSLQTLKGEISKSIGNLVNQTKTLFKAYNNLIEEVFGK